MSDGDGQPGRREGGARRRPTRRELVAGVGLAGAALIAPAPARAAQAASGTEVSTSPAQDRQILERLLHTERLLQYAYEQALSSGHLQQTSEKIVPMLLDQEFAHARALEHHLAAIPTRSAGQQQGHSAHPQPFPPAAVAALFKQVKTETGSIKGVVEIESLAQFTYFTAVGQLGDPRLARLAAEILASESQHWTLLAALVHKGRPEESVPHPFVRGAQQLTPL